MGYDIIQPPNPALILANQAIPRYFVLPELSDTPIGNTYIGTPYYDQLVFSAIANPGNGGTPIDALFLKTVLLEVNMTKLVIKTSVTGRNGTVKEYISDGDYMVNIKGSIVSGEVTGLAIPETPSQYPKTPLANLIKICKVPQAVTVSSGFLQFFGIGSIVIESYKINEQMGSRNMVPFEINASSDVPLTFQLI